jgi:hypothetical protein
MAISIRIRYHSPLRSCKLRSIPTKVNRVGIIGLLLLILLLPGGLQAADYDVPEGDSNIFGITLGGGANLTKDAVFGSVSVDYDRLIGKNWGLSAGLGYEREWEDKNDNTQEQDTITILFGGFYKFSPEWNVTLTSGLGVLETEENNLNHWKSIGDFSLSLSLGRSFQTKAGTISLSPTVDYNFNNGETKIGLDFSISWGW